MSVFSQEKVIKHKVLKGETISEIADQYNIKPSEIYSLNPKAKKGIKFHTVLLISSKSKTQKGSTPEIVTNYSEITHDVLPKETLYGITKQYNVSLEDLYKSNPNLEKEGLKKGQKLIISQKNTDKSIAESKNEKVKEPQKAVASIVIAPKVEAVILPKAIEKLENTALVNIHEVLPKETRFSIAKLYGISLLDLVKANPIMGDKSLKIGQKISIPTKVENHTNLVAKVEVSNTKNEIAVVAQPIIENKLVETETTHTVVSKETKYGIAKQYGISVKELEEQNPKIVKELPTGYVLKIRSLKKPEGSIPVEVVINEPVANEVSDKIVNNAEHDSTFVDKLILKASENIGTRYRSGGTTKEGFDCSGLMCSTFGAYNIQLPRSSIEMASYGVKINTENAQKGDLIFFKTRGGRQINHVGMVVEVVDGDIKFIHSSTSGGVIISSIKERYYDKNFVQINRIL
jgi:cell wall-associated NlpC family hydrolase